jgi:glycosyltransferase involved in cell wall biosynthesis
MRVLISALSCNAGHGSEALVGYKYAEALAHGHDVTVLAAPPSEAPRGVSLYPIKAGACNFNDVAAGNLLRFELGQLPQAWRLNGQRRFDVVHRVTPSWIGNPSLLPVIRAPFVIGPLLAAERPPEGFASYLSRGALPASPGRWRPRRVAAGLARRLRDLLTRRQVHLRQARKILVGTQAALQQVPARFRGRCEPIAYAGVEHDVFTPPPDRPSSGPVRLLYVGRAVAYKGLELLLRAVARARRQCDLRLQVVGGGNPVYLAYCGQLAVELGLQDLVTFAPGVARHALPALYQGADIFCFPTLCDTYGIALLEAMSCACAVLVSDVGGPREMVTPATGIKIPVRDPEQYIHDYAEALVGLAGNARQRAELGQAARRRILAEHDWQRIGAQIRRIYETI